MLRECPHQESKRREIRRLQIPTVMLITFACDYFSNPARSGSKRTDLTNPNLQNYIFCQKLLSKILAEPESI